MNRCACCDRPADLCLCDPNRSRPPGPPYAMEHDCATVQAHHRLGAYVSQDEPRRADYLRLNFAGALEGVVMNALRPAFIAAFRAGAEWQKATGGDGRVIADAHLNKSEG